MNITGYRQKKKAVKNNGSTGVSKTISVLLLCFLLFQVFSPGDVFCMKEGNRMISCRYFESCYSPDLETVIQESVIKDACCAHENGQIPASLPENEIPIDGDGCDDGSCCISLALEHHSNACFHSSYIHIIGASVCSGNTDIFSYSNRRPHINPFEKSPPPLGLRSVILII